MKPRDSDIDRAEAFSLAVDQLIRQSGAGPQPVDPAEAEAHDAARYVVAAVGRMAPPSPALERRVAAAARQAAQRAGRPRRLSPAWAIGAVAVFLLALTLLTPVGHDALASFMAVFRLGRTEITITPGSLPSVTSAATAVAGTTAVQENLTLEEAQQQVRFAIPRPAYLPAGYRLRGAVSYTYPDLPAWVPQPFAVELVYEDAGGHSFVLRLYPILLGDRATISRLNLEANPIQDVRDVDVDGRPGVLLRLGPEGGPATWQEVVWEQGDLILALSTADLGEDELLRVGRSVR